MSDHSDRRKQLEHIAVLGSPRRRDQTRYRLGGTGTTSSLQHPVVSFTTLNALEVALDQRHEVKAKVGACAVDFATANGLVKEWLADGEAMLPAA